MEKVRSTSLPWKSFTALSIPLSSMESVISMMTLTTPLPNTNWSTFLGLLPELQASQPVKSSCPFLSMTMEPEALITPSKLPMSLTTWLLTTTSRTSLSNDCAQLTKTMFCVMTHTSLSDQMQWEKLLMSKMIMEHINPTPSKKSATPFLTTLPPMDTLLLLAIAFFPTWAVVKRIPQHVSPNFSHLLQETVTCS